MKTNRPIRVHLDDDPIACWEFACRQLRLLRVALDAIEEQGSMPDEGELAHSAIDVLEHIEQAVQLLDPSRRAEPVAGGAR